MAWFWAMSQFYTDYLTPTGSMLVGAASAFAIAGGFFRYNMASTPEQADAIALRQDFAVVGQDIAAGERVFREENKERLCA